MTTQEHNEIIRWLFLNHDKYPSAHAWRKALVDKLDEMVDGERCKTCGDIKAAGEPPHCLQCD